MVYRSLCPQKIVRALHRTNTGTAKQLKWFEYVAMFPAFSERCQSWV